MKKTLLFTVCLLVCLGAMAQADNQSIADTGIRSVNLGEVVVKGKEPDKMGNKVRSQNVFIVLNPVSGGSATSKNDAVYYTTKFPQPEDGPITLHSVQLRLRQFDTSLFDIKLLVFQVQGKDTLNKVVPVNTADIDRKNNLKVLLYDKQITLQPGDFFIGYGFHTKQLVSPFKYRMYASDKGEGAILTFRPGGGVTIISDVHMPYVFPFKISYRKY